MAEIDWQSVIGAALVAIGAPTALISAFAAWRGKIPAVPNPAPPADGSKPRGADDFPSKSAVDWVADIRSAMGAADPASVLASLSAGESRDQARARRIAELEAKP